MPPLPEASPSVGINLSGVSYFSTQHAFIDRFKTSSDWIPSAPGQWDTGADVAVDSNGWPTEIPDGATRLTTIVSVDPQSEWPSGRYVVIYSGTGTLSYGTGTDLIESESSDGYHVVVVDQDDAAATQRLYLSISSTSADDPIRDIHIVREDQLPAYYAGEIFNPAFVDQVEDFRSLRFMNWMDTNDSDVQDWSDFPQVGDASWANGVPLEVMVELANRTGTDPWFCIPAHATDEAVRQFAAYVRDHLDPRLQAHIEFSNEVWNYQFEQTRYAADAADDLWAVDTNNNGTIDQAERVPGGASQWYGMRSAEVFDIFTEAFGSAADARLDLVLATHTGWEGLENYILNAPRWTAEGNAAPYTHADSYAITGYFEGGLTRSENLATVLQWASEGAVGLSKAFQQLEFGNLLPGGVSLADLIESYSYQANVAQAYGLDLIMYESGAHLVSMDGQLTEFFAALQQDPRMGELFEKNMDAFAAAGGTMFNHFGDVGDPTSKYGFWGPLESIYQDGSSRWNALKNYNANHSGDWDGRPHSAFANGEYVAGQSGNDLFTGGEGGDRLVGNGGDDVLVGNGGFDSLIGGTGNDTLNGGLGNDTLDGGSGNDTLDGGAGNDILTGGSGVDILRGGDGDDIIYYDAADNLSQLNGGAGFDSLAFLGAWQAINLSLYGFEQSLAITTDSGSQSWSSITDVHDLAGNRIRRETLNDNNTSTVVEYDVYNQYGWSTRTRSYDASGVLTGEVLVADGGVNLGPTDLRLSASTVIEGVGNGTVVGTLSATDPTAGETFTYALLNNAGGRFGLNGNQLVVASSAALDFETSTSHTVTVQVTDSAGSTYQEIFTIGVTNNPADDAPTSEWSSVTRTGTSASNTLSGTTGKDWIQGLGGNDTISGASNNDKLEGGTGNDTLNGDAGNDLLLGGDGNDTLNGGTGADTLNGEAGIDTLSYSGSTSAVTVNLSANAVSGGDAAGDHISNFESIVGSSYADTLTGSALANTIDGGSGNDTLDGGAGNDILTGGSGVDILRGGDGDDIIYYDAADNLSQLNGGAGFDSLAFLGAWQAINLSLYGFEQSLAITTDSGSQSWSSITDVHDLAGNRIRRETLNDNNTSTVVEYDVYNQYGWSTRTRSYDASGVLTGEVLVGDNPSPTDLRLSASTVIEGVGNGTVVGTLSATDPTAGETFTYALLNNAGGRFGLNGNQLVVASSAALDFETSTSHTVTVQVTDSAGSTYQEIFTIGVTNNPADDAPTSEWSSVTRTGTSASNTLSGTTGKDWIQGLGGNDTISGASNNDKLEGGTGNDTLNGSAGNDLLLGGDGNDTLNGGTGTDTLNGEAGIDTLSYSGSTSAVTVNLSANAVSGGDAAGDRIFNFENIVGSSYADTLTGSALANTIDGGSGNDTLDGGAGNDRLIGGAGVDLLNGGLGLDTFVLANTAASRDVIHNFVALDDTLEISKAAFGGALSFGVLSAARFVSNTTGLAGDTSDRFIFNSSNGVLSYDSDGTGSAQAIQIATFTGTLPSLSASDFLIV